MTKKKFKTCTLVFKLSRNVTKESDGSNMIGQNIGKIIVSYTRNSVSWKK